MHGVRYIYTYVGFRTYLCSCEYLYLLLQVYRITIREGGGGEHLTVEASRYITAVCSAPALACCYSAPHSHRLGWGLLCWLGPESAQVAAAWSWAAHVYFTCGSRLTERIDKLSCSVPIRKMLDFWAQYLYIYLSTRVPSLHMCSLHICTTNTEHCVYICMYVCVYMYARIGSTSGHIESDDIDDDDVCYTAFLLPDPFTDCWFYPKYHTLPSLIILEKGQIIAFTVVAKHFPSSWPRHSINITAVADLCISCIMNMLLLQLSSRGLYYSTVQRPSSQPIECDKQRCYD